MAWRYVCLLVDAAGAVLCNGRVSVRPCVRLYAPWHVVVCGVRTYKRGTVKRGQLIAGQLSARTHNRSDN